MPSKVWRSPKKQKSVERVPPVVIPVDESSRRTPAVMDAPAHPVAQLQGPFEESMTESQNAVEDELEIPLDASSRRNMLLEAPTYQRVIAGRWKRKPGERYHPLWKLVAQMSFGVHLLAENMARSEEDVFQILQTHVDDIDIFLERNTEDFTLAQDDIQERLKCLRLPLQHPEVFDRMLEDRAFRNSIVEGNEKIEHIVNRTGCAMKDALKDVQKGFDSTSTLEKYLIGLEVTWVRTSPEHEAVLVAMLGNVEGWKRAFLDLHTQGNKLNGALRKLTEVVNQMQQRAGEVSRRLIKQHQRGGGGSISNSSAITYISQPPSSSRTSSRQQHALSVKRPLPASSAHSFSMSTHHSRNASRDESRADTRQTQRSGTGLSSRSNNDLHADMSRAASRSENMFAGQSQTNPGLGIPRLVYVKNNPSHSRSTSQSSVAIQSSPPPADVVAADHPLAQQRSQQFRSAPPNLQIQTQNIAGRQVIAPSISSQEPRNDAPVELPAELPPTAFLQAPVSSMNRLSTSGVLPSERRAQANSRTYNPTNALIELLSDPSRLSRIPTPTSTNHSAPQGASANSEGSKGSDSRPVQSARKGSVSDVTTSNRGDGSVASAPGTPSWASRTFDEAERQRALAEKIPFGSHPPDGTLSTPPLNTRPSLQSLPSRQRLHIPVNGPNNAGTGFSKVSKSFPAELSAGYEDNLPMPPRINASESSMLIETPQTTTVSRKKASFIAELQGSEPLFLPPTIYTPRSIASGTSDSHELDGSDSYFDLPIQSNVEDEAPSQAVDGKTSETMVTEQAQAGATSTADNAALDESLQQLEQAIRKSITDADIELPPETQEVDKRMDEPLDSPEVETPRAGVEPVLLLTEAETSPVSAIPRSPLLLTQQVYGLDDSDSQSQKRVTAIHDPPSDSPAVHEPSSAQAALSDLPSQSGTAVNEQANAPYEAAEAPYVRRASSPLITVTNSDDIEKEGTVPSDSEDAEKLQGRTPTTPRAIISHFLRTPRRPSTPVSSSGSAPPPEKTRTGSVSSAGLGISPDGKSGSLLRPLSPAAVQHFASAPAADLRRSNTGETRKQWKAFFTGQLKPAKSRRKSRTESILETMKLKRHSQNNVPEDSSTMGFASSQLSPVNEAATESRSPIAEMQQQQQPIAETRPPLVELRQNSSPDAAFKDSFVGLGMLTSPEERQVENGFRRSPNGEKVTAAVYRSFTAASKTGSPRLIEVKRKAVGSGVSTRSASAASQIPTHESCVSKVDGDDGGDVRSDVVVPSSLSPPISTPGKSEGTSFETQRVLTPHDEVRPVDVTGKSLDVQYEIFDDAGTSTASHSRESSTDHYDIYDAYSR